jgi:ABC-2 type transport system ATP-binding protein
LELRNLAYDEGQAQQMLESLDLDPASLDKSVRTLSKGMTQKLGLAACFLCDQPFLLLDEPMSGLDPKARALVKRHLHAPREKGKTLLFSTHMLSDVLELCDRMIILHRGRLCFAGSPAECCEQYRADSLEQAYLNCIENRAA